MAAANPASAAGGEPGTGTDPGEQGARTGGSEGSQDYLGRIRGDADFAEREVRNQQSRADRAEAELRKHDSWLGKLRMYRDQGLGGDALFEHLERYAGWTSDQKLMHMIERYQQGGHRGEPDMDEGGMDEEDEPQRQLRARFSEHDNELAGMSEILAQRAVTDHLDRLFGEYPFSPEKRKAIGEAIQKQVGSWSKDSAGRQSIRRLATPDGYETISALALSRVSREDIEHAIDQSRSLRKQRLQGLETDSPSGLGTKGDEAPPEFKGVNRALQAYQWFGERHGLGKE